MPRSRIKTRLVTSQRRKDAKAVPLRELQKQLNGDKRRVPVREPTIAPDEDQALYMEQQVARVEALMLRGMRNPKVIASQLNLEPSTAKRCIQKVHARWEIVGSNKNLQRHRGEMLSKLDIIEQQLWSHVTKNNTEANYKPATVMHALSMLMQLGNMRNELMGLNGNAIEELNSRTGSAIDDTIKSRMVDQERLVGLAAKILEIAKQVLPQKTLEHRPTKIIDVDSD